MSAFIPFLSGLTDPTLRTALEAGLTDPAQGLELARTAWATARTSPDPVFRAHTALSLGLALNRAERYVEAFAVLTELEANLKSLALTKELALCQWQIGVASRFLRTAPDFVEKLERSLAALLTAGLKIEAACCRRDLAAAYNWKGKYEQSASQTSQARVFFEAQGLIADAAMCAFAESAHLRWTGRFAEALDILQRAEAIFAQASLPVERATASLYQGSVYASNMQFDAALSRLREAYAEFERLDLPVRLAFCRNELGRVTTHRGHLREAEATYQANLNSFSALGMRADLARTQLNLANVRYDQGELDEAARLYAQAQAEFRALGNAFDEALCELNLGVCKRGLGRYGSALHHLERARAAMAALGAADSVALAHHNLGHVWFDLGDPDKAAHHLAVAVQTYQESGALFPAARSLVQMALVETHQGRTAEALAHLQEARRVCEEAKAHGYLAICDQIAGEIQAHIGNYAQALHLLGAAEAAFTSVGMPLNALACRIVEADICLALGEHERAERLYQDGLARAEFSLPDLAWRCAAGLAHIAGQQGRLEAMLTWHCRVVRAMSQARRGLHHEKLVATFLTSRLAALNNAIAAAVKSEQPDMALSFVEESRAQRLAFRRTHLHQPPEAGASDERHALRRELVELRHRVGASLDSEFGWSIIRPATPEQQSLLAELEDKARQYELLTMLYDDGADDRNADRLAFNLSNLRRALSTAAPAGWTCLAYYWVGDTLLIFVIDAESLKVYTRHLQPLDQTAFELCASPEADRRRHIYGAAPQRNTLQPRASAIYLKRLHDLLLPAPLHDRLSPSHLLMIVPAGPLHALPFHALTDGSAYLCEGATIAYTPSLAHLDFCLRQAARCPTQIHSALIVAVEDFDGAMPPLPQASREAELVQTFFPRSTVLQDALATPEAVTEVIRSDLSGNHHILHFATHGVFEAGFGRLSRLVFYHGDLQADEIEQLPLNARLVVLSACQSALGQVHLGEEAVGLTQAFFAAGVPSVLSTLWAVEDKVAPAFMADFYENLIRRRLAPALALATTQRKWIAEGQSPHDWAAFGFYGVP